MLDPEQLRTQARQRDRQAPVGPLHGVPIGIKDVIDTAVMPTEYNSTIYQGHRPTADADCVARLKAAGAKLVWGSTTPIRHSSTNVFEKGTEIEYNALAAKVMAKHGIPTNDMYTFVKGLIDMNKPAGHGADPFFFDRKPIHPPLSEILRTYLAVVPEK